eukprot:CAMPEP_0184653430 /NCGR_PEP_ID=MMETSP0308-20130426/11151_1 /TAXON_ID=38269 /ORGANISM="Gloeochaete witrockiana, Strain SAG 46.84" /LENGTH=591 /DNA_ID=CAMNT_0027088881 /DNA_START=113 /DNA_END=1888 /DNA_ORIENTATION=+
MATSDTQLPPARLDSPLDASTPSTLALNTTNPGPPPKKPDSSRATMDSSALSVTDSADPSVAAALVQISAGGHQHQDEPDPYNQRKRKFWTDDTRSPTASPTSIERALIKDFSFIRRPTTDLQEHKVPRLSFGDEEIRHAHAIVRPHPSYHSQLHPSTHAHLLHYDDIKDAKPRPKPRRKKCKIKFEEARRLVRSMVTAHPKYKENRHYFLRGTACKNISKARWFEIAHELGIDISAYEDDPISEDDDHVLPSTSVTSTPVSHTPAMLSDAESDPEGDMMDGHSDHTEGSDAEFFARHKRGNKPKKSPIHNPPPPAAAVCKGRYDWERQKSALQYVITHHPQFIAHREYYLNGANAGGVYRMRKSEILDLATQLGVDLEPFRPFSSPSLPASCVGGKRVSADMDEMEDKLAHAASMVIKSDSSLSAVVPDYMELPRRPRGIPMGSGPPGDAPSSLSLSRTPDDDDTVPSSRRNSTSQYESCDSKLERPLRYVDDEHDDYSDVPSFQNHSRRSSPSSQPTPEHPSQFEDLSEFLEVAGCSPHAKRLFLENAIDMSVVLSKRCTMEFLIGVLGVKAGDAIKILDARDRIPPDN